MITITVNDIISLDESMCTILHAGCAINACGTAACGANACPADICVTAGCVANVCINACTVDGCIFNLTPAPGPFSLDD